MTKVQIYGSGPAGLMCASWLVLSGGQYQVEICESRKSAGRKLLIAGASGLNITFHADTIDDFVQNYSGFVKTQWKKWLENFGPAEWRSFIENTLGHKTFVGTSRRCFVEEMKGAQLLQSWVKWLQDSGVVFKYETPFQSLSSLQESSEIDFAVLALGGAAWESQPPSWAAKFMEEGMDVVSFSSSNAGFDVRWTPDFIKESAMKPLHRVTLKTSKGEKHGELMITDYGIEGTPVYFVGCEGPAAIDLLPTFSIEEILVKLKKVRENYAPLRMLQHGLDIQPVVQSLLFHHAPKDVLKDLRLLVQYMKSFPLALRQARQLSEAISSKGGVALHELNKDFSLKKFPKIYCVGEMLDWDAPTGGFLIQACVSQGAAAGASINMSLVK